MFRGYSGCSEGSSFGFSLAAISAEIEEVADIDMEEGLSKLSSQLRFVSGRSRMNSVPISYSFESLATALTKLNFGPLDSWGFLCGDGERDCEGVETGDIIGVERGVFLRLVKGDGGVDGVAEEIL